MRIILIIFGGTVKKNKIQSKGLVQRFTSDLCGKISMIEIHSDFEMFICGCVGIIEYTSSEIIVETISGIIKITGNCLQLDVFQGDTMTVCGKILNLWLGDFND